MKILVLSHSSVVGLYRGKLEALSRREDVTVRLIVPPEWPEGGTRVRTTAADAGSFTTSVIPAFRKGYIASYVYHPLMLRRVVTEFSPTIIYAEEEPWSVAAWQGLRLSRTMRCAFLFFTWENIWKRYKRISERLLRSVLHGSDGAVAGNEEAAGILERRNFHKPVIVVPQYGVDADRFSPPTASPKRDVPVVIYIGRLEHEKGVDILLSALSRIPEPWLLRILGGGSERGKMAELTDALRLSDRVTFMPPVPYEEIPRILAGSDILVLPSRTTDGWKEQFGRVLTEAMSSGLCVVGSDSGAIPEVIGDSGVIVAEDDVEGLARSLGGLLSSPTRRLDLGRRARTRVEMMFSNAVIADRLYEFFSMITRDRTWLKHGSKD